MSRYLAFISYRHVEESSDAALRLRKSLESWHLPKDCPLPKRRRIFRDTDELPTSSDLGTDIERALEDSEWLIALCSEEYVASRWCMKEIELFIASGRKDRILPVLISGSPKTAVPEEIRDLPLAADLSRENAAPGRPPVYDRQKAKAAVPALLSLMSGMRAERIAGAERRYRAAAAGAAVACLALGMLGFASYAANTAARIEENNAQIIKAAEETEEAKRQALAERDSALLKQAEYLSEQAWKALNLEDGDRAIELALSALPEDLHGDLPVSADAVGALRTALSMELPPSFHLAGTAETDFIIKDYYKFASIDDRIFLTGENIEPGEHYVTYKGETGILETIFTDSRQRAAEAGYTKLFHFPGTSTERRHFYIGPGKQLYSEHYEDGRNHTSYTLNGEPFCPVDGALDSSYGYFVAWEDGNGSGSPRSALFKKDQPEALALLDLSAKPVSVSFSSNAGYFLIADDSGSASVFDVKKGTKLMSVGGGVTEVFYLYNSGEYAFIGFEDGRITLLDLDTFKEEFSFSCPSAVRHIRAYRERSCLLVCCDSGVYLYHFKTGTLMFEFGEGERPNFAIFKNDEGNHNAEIDMVLLIYDRRVDLYALDTDIDRSVTDYRPLFAEGIPNGSDMSYSKDGKRIYQLYTVSVGLYEPGEFRIACWDAYSGELLWTSANPYYCYRSTFSQSEDGRALWRLYDETGIGIEKLDAVSGEDLMYLHLDGKFWEPLGGPLEAPDKKRVLIACQQSSTSTLNHSKALLMLDTEKQEYLWRFDLDKESGEWTASDQADPASMPRYPHVQKPGLITAAERKGFAEVFFSEDGSFVCCAQNAERKADGKSGIVIDRLDSLTGEVLDELFFEMKNSAITRWAEEQAFVFIDEQPEEVNVTGHSIYKGGKWIYPEYTGNLDGEIIEHSVCIFDLKEWKWSAQIPFTYVRSPEAYNRVLMTARSLDGGMALYWEGDDGEGDGEDYCCRLNKDGSLGPVYEADSAEGRRLWVSKDDYLIFNGEEAFLEASRISRLSDGSLMLAGVWTSTLDVAINGSSRDLLFSQGSNIDRGIAAAKDGASVCVFTRYKSETRMPFLVLPSDLDTLVEKGRRRMERRK